VLIAILILTETRTGCTNQAGFKSDKPDVGGHINVAKEELASKMKTF